MESKLEFPQSAILTPYNYFEWKPKIQLHLRSRGLFRITMEMEVEPTSAMEKTRYFNRMDEAFGILCLSISPELLFHVESCSTPNEVWKKLEGLFGKQDEMLRMIEDSIATYRNCRESFSLEPAVYDDDEPLDSISNLREIERQTKLQSSRARCRDGKELGALEALQQIGVEKPFELQPKEGLAIVNGNLRGFEIIDDAKQALEDVCPKVVSCADILVLSTWDALDMLGHGSPYWKVRIGCRDGRVSLASEANANIPSPFANFSEQKTLFQSKGFSVQDLVTLSGAHTIGVAHCGTFSPHLYNFSGKGDSDPSLDRNYAKQLKAVCKTGEASTVVATDPGSQMVFDNNYYVNVQENRGLFIFDAALLTDGEANNFANLHLLIFRFRASPKSISAKVFTAGGTWTPLVSTGMSSYASKFIPVFTWSKTSSTFKSLAKGFTSRSREPPERALEVVLPHLLPPDAPHEGFFAPDRLLILA